MEAPIPPGERHLTALVRRLGCPDLGLNGPVIEVHERVRHGLAKVRVLTLREALTLRDELDGALRALRFGAELAEADRPRAYTGPWPIRGATLAEIDLADSSEGV